MSHSPGGFVHLDKSDADVEKVVGSDVEEVVTWDHELCRTKTFSTAFLILSGRRFDSPNRYEQQKILFNFIDQPAHDYFMSRSQQARAFDELKIVCKLGWTANSVTSRKKKWNVHFVAEHLAILLVLRRQVEKEKEARVEVERSSRSASKGGVPKATSLKRAFRKLWRIYEPSLKLFTQAERDAENVVHRTPSLSLQLTGAHDQDHVPWGRWTEFESNCPVCTHASTMPMQSREDVNAANSRLREAAEANGGDGKFEAAEMKVGCYCWGQNCFGDRDGIGCWKCVDLAMEKGELSADAVEPGVCRFDCDVCRCSCQCTFVESKRHTITNGLKKNGMKNKPIETQESQREGGRLLFFDYVKNNLDNFFVREFQDVDSRSKFEVVTDIATKTAIDISSNTAMQCNPNVMRGLQEIIPGRRTNIEMRTLAGGGKKKVSISIQQARKELKGRGVERKNPPEMPSFDDNTPPASNFLSNAGNRTHRNRLSSAPLRPPVMLMTGTPKATASSPPQMMERVQKRVMDKLFDAATTPQTKRVVAKVHAQLAQKDATFTSVSTATRISSPRRRFLLPALTFNEPWDRGAQVTWQTTAPVLVRRTSFHNYYLVNHYYYNLVPMVPTVNKRFFKSFDLISRQCYLVLKPIQVPILLLLQPNLLHHLTDLVLDWAVFWMVRRPRDN